MPFTVKRFKDYIYNELNQESRTRHMNDRAIQFEDAEGRKIKISPDEGVQVEDSEGTIIHDTPDCLIASDMNYGGHIYFKNAGSYVGDAAISYIDTGTSLDEWTSVINNSISSALPSDLTNPSAVLLSVKSIVWMDGLKTQDKALIYVQSVYSNTYNSSGSVYNFMDHLENMAIEPNSTESDMRIASMNQIVCPITWNGTSPYITWNQFVHAQGMTAVSGGYYGKTWVYLQGFLV